MNDSEGFWITDLGYTHDGTSFRGKLVRAAITENVRGGVLLAPDWRGMSPHALEEAKRLASHDYLVFVVDLYGDGRYADDEKEAKGLLQGLLEHRARTSDRLHACLAAFSQSLPASTRIAALGFSIGGMALLDFGRAGASLAGIVVSSALLKNAESGGPKKLSCPLLVLQGTLDVVCPMDVVGSLVKELDEGKNDFRVVLYGGAHHAFYNPTAGTDETARLCYSAKTAALANAATDRFFEKSFA